MPVGKGEMEAGGAPTVGYLERRLGLLDLILLGIGASIGSGIFVVTGVVAKTTGPSVVLSFGIAGLASVIDALCYAELSSRFPGLVGGAYLYTYTTFGELWAFLLFCHLMFDYHIGAASIARSLSAYLASLVQDGLGPNLPLPAVFAPGGLPLLGGALSVNLLAPLILLALTWVLCRGVRESVSVNGVLTSVKVVIVLIVAAAGAALVEPTNWVPFAPNGFQAVVASASVVFFSYIGFDAVANTAEESKNPQRDVPLGILISLSVCAVLYIAVCLVLTGMVPYSSLDVSAPLSGAFAARGMRGLEAFIDAGAVVGLTTTLLAGLYVQARLYLAIARDGLLPLILARVTASHLKLSPSLRNTEGSEAERHIPPLRSVLGTVDGSHPEVSPPIPDTEGSGIAPSQHHIPSLPSTLAGATASHPGVSPSNGNAEGSESGPSQHHIPLNAQVWVGLVAATMAALFDVSRLSHVLSVGVLLSYSLVCVCVPILRLSSHVAGSAAPGGPSSTRATASCTGSPIENDEYLSLGAESLPLAHSPPNPSQSIVDRLTQAVGSTHHSDGSTAKAGSMPHSEGSTQEDGSVAAAVHNTSAFPSPNSVAWNLRRRAVVAFSLVAVLSLLLGLASRFLSSPLLCVLLVVCLLGAASQLFFLSSHSTPPYKFSCPGVPWVPALGVIINMYLIAQMHAVAWLRLALITALGLGVFWAFERGRPRARSSVCSAAACSEGLS